MRDLVYAASAEDDFNGILRYITLESGSREIGFAFIAKLHRGCERLASLPSTLGTARPELRPDIRSVTKQGHIFFFRYASDRIEIVNVLAGQRDIDAHFDGPETPQSH